MHVHAKAASLNQQSDPPEVIQQSSFRSDGLRPVLTLCQSLGGQRTLQCESNGWDSGDGGCNEGGRGQEERTCTADISTSFFMSGLTSPRARRRAAEAADGQEEEMEGWREGGSGGDDKEERNVQKDEHI
jgi:hypothetical protein